MEKKVFIVMIVGILFLVGIFSLFHKGNIDALSGVYTEYDKPQFSIDAYWSGEYQTNMDHYYSTNYALHNFNVRLYNQVRYSMYNISNSVETGQNGYLYEKSYIQEKLGLEGAVLLSDDEIYALAHQILMIQESAIDGGKGFLFIITPSKADYVPENIPKKYQYMDSLYMEEDRNYIRLRHALDELGVNYIDCNDFLSDETIGAPVFYASGIHWSRLAADYTLNEIFARLNQDYSYNIPFVEVTGVTESSTTEDSQDQDLLRLLNVWSAKKDAVYYIPIEEVEEQEESEKIALFMQGGSFTNKLMQIVGEHRIFSEAKQEFYAEWLQDYNEGTGVNGNMESEEFREAVQQADVIILETNVENVSGLMPDMYNSIYQCMQEVGDDGF